MSEAIANRYYPDEVSPPGETLREALEERGMTQAELAVRMNRPEKTLSEIVRGKAALTPDTAIQLELALGIPADFWLARESRYRENLSRRQQENDLGKQGEWAARFPTRKMIQYGWIDKQKNKNSEVRELLGFFNVASAAGWTELYSVTRARFRKSRKFECDSAALAAWLQQGWREATSVQCEAFSRDVFRRCLLEIRPLTREQRPEVLVSQLQETCRRAGVAVVFVPELPGARVSGTTRWMTSSKALIQLSLRYKTNDHLWFTFFHEAGHILLHKKREIFLEANGGDSKDELEANRFAADMLIPPDEYKEFVAGGVTSKEQVREFAARVDIADGVVVGRLQRDKIIPHHSFNALKVRYEWVAAEKDPPG